MFNKKCYRCGNRLDELNATKDKIGYYCVNTQECEDRRIEKAISKDFFGVLHDSLEEYDETIKKLIDK